MFPSSPLPSGRLTVLLFINTLLDVLGIFMLCRTSGEATAFQVLTTSKSDATL